MARIEAPPSPTTQVLDTRYLKLSGGVLTGNTQLTSTNALQFGTTPSASIYYDGTNLVINPKVAGSGYLSVLGDLYLTGDLNITKNYPQNKFIDTGTSQYSGSGFFMYNNNSSFGNNAGVHLSTLIIDTNATQMLFNIDKFKYDGSYVENLISIDINNDATSFATTVRATGYQSSDGSAGISTTVTTASLVGKTITFKNGLVTGFA